MALNKPLYFSRDGTVLGCHHQAQDISCALAKVLITDVNGFSYGCCVAVQVPVFLHTARGGGG